MVIKPDPLVYQDTESWPKEIVEEMKNGLFAGHFARVGEELGANVHPRPETLTKLKALEKVAQAAGKDAKFELTPIAVSFKDRKHDSGVVQPACVECGNCFTGCNIGSKNTVNMNYIADARAKGAEIFTEVEVTHISQSNIPEYPWIVHVNCHVDKEEAFAVS